MSQEQSPAPVGNKAASTPAVDVSRRSAVAVVVAATVAMVVMFVPFLREGYPAGTDMASHLAEILQVARVLKSGQTDFWFDGVNLGSPLFIAYQPVPMLLMGGLVALTDRFIAPLLLFKISTMLLWAALPAAWYTGGRWLGMSRRAALAMVVLVIWVRDDTWAVGLSLVSLTRYGRYTHGYGMVVLPLVAGSLYQLLMEDRRGLLRPTLLYAVTSLVHVFFGLYAAIGGALMVFLRRERALARAARRLALVFGLTAALIAWWLVPFIANRDLQGGLPWKQPKDNGYSLGELAAFAWRGEFFDYGRLPWLTLLCALGFIRALFFLRRPLERWLVLLSMVTFVLFLGRTTFGGLYDRLPFHADFEVIRYLAGLHFCGISLAALLLGDLATRAVALHRAESDGPAGWLPAGGLQAAIALAMLGSRVVPGWTELKPISPTSEGLDSLIGYVRTHTQGRLLTHRKVGVGGPLFRNLVPTLAGQPQLESMSRGYHDSLNLYYVEKFDWSAAELGLYNIGTIVTRKGTAPLGDPDLFRLAWQNDFEEVHDVVHPSSYFEFVRTPIVLDGTLRELRQAALQIAPRLYSAHLAARLAPDPVPDRVVVRGRTTTLYASGAPVPSDVATYAEQLAARLGGPPIQSRRIADERVALNEYSTRVAAHGNDERLLLKVTYHHYWHAYVDGQEVPIDHIAPSLMAIDVPAGEHDVLFRYRNPPYQKILFLLALGGLMTAIAVETRRASAPTPRGDGGSTPKQHPSR